MPFPGLLYTQPAPAVAGDFASSYPRFGYNAGPGGLVSGPAGLVIGRFAWVDPANQILASNTGSGPVSGWVHREGQALITAYLAEIGYVIPPGENVTLMTGCDAWVVNSGATEAVVGQYAYASFANGSISFAASGAASTASGSTSSIAPATCAVTGSISGNVLTVTGVTSGTVYPGVTFTGTGVATGTQVTSQIGGTAGGIGTYYVSIPDQTVTSTALAGTYGVLTVAGAVAGTFVPGGGISGSGVTAGSQVWSQLTGAAGGAGTYVVSPSQTAASEAVTQATSVQTKWFAQTPGPAGGLIKITSQPLG